MNAVKASQLGTVIRNNVALKLFGGIKTSGSVNSLALQQRNVSGAFRQRLPQSDNNLTFRCNINVCEDNSVCGA